MATFTAGSGTKYLRTGAYLEIEGVMAVTAAHTMYFYSDSGIGILPDAVLTAASGCEALFCWPFFLFKTFRLELFTHQCVI
jgi:hypothetical protein